MGEKKTKSKYVYVSLDLLERLMVFGKVNKLGFTTYSDGVKWAIRKALDGGA